ncbi:uncharacterized [Tachysurus ichikawai]
MPRDKAVIGFEECSRVGWSCRLMVKYFKNVHDPLNLHSFNIRQQYNTTSTPTQIGVFPIPFPIPPPPLNRDIRVAPPCRILQALQA